jgi:hypothetical protein
MRSFLRTLAILSLAVVLVACRSAKRSYAITERVLDRLPVPDNAVQLYVGRVERLSKTGIGTSFGTRSLYGVQTSYSSLTEQLSELLVTAGWQQYGTTGIGNPHFCHADYADLRLSIADVKKLDRDELGIPLNVLSESGDSYETLYIITVVHFPFDETGLCK